MICDGNFVLRKGKKGDKLPPGYLGDENDVPAFVLELNGKQVGSACTQGEDKHIFMISTFDWNKGYCTKFLELWENYAREKGFTELIVSHVASDPLEHILEKRGYCFEFDKCNEKIYHKKLVTRLLTR